MVVAIIVGIVALWAVLLILLWLVRPRGVATRDLLRVVPDLVRLLRSLIADSNTPLDVRVVLVCLVVWIASPIDLIPEFIPVIGPLDDVVVGVLALRYARKRIGIDKLRAHWPGTEDGFVLVARVIGRQ